MCNTCQSERRSIATLVQQKRSNSARASALRDSKRRDAESISRQIKGASSPSAKASLRNSKTRRNENYANQLDGIKRQNEGLSDRIKRMREGIKRRHS